jgi:hypothetical protein
MTKKQRKNVICRNKKKAPKVKNHVFSEKIENDGLYKFLGHVFPILYDASQPLWHRDIWAS